MKDIIVLCCVLPLTIALIFLVGSINTNATNEEYVRETVASYVDKMSIDGCLTSANEEEMKEKIATAMNISADDIEVVTSNTIKYRPDFILYSITVPIEKVVPAGTLFGISDSENKGKIEITGKIMSERLMP